MWGHLKGSTLSVKWMVENCRQVQTVSLQMLCCQREVDGTWRCPRVWIPGRESGCRPRPGLGWCSPSRPGRFSWSWSGCWSGWRPEGPGPISTLSRTEPEQSEPVKIRMRFYYNPSNIFQNLYSVSSVKCDELVTRDGDTHVTSYQYRLIPLSIDTETILLTWQQMDSPDICNAE